MCRLLALSSRRVPPAAVLDKFKALAFEGRTPTLGPDARGHNDGWGLAGFFGSRVVFEKNALSATDPQGGWDEAIKRLMIPALWPGHAMFHLRRASAGMEVRVANSHPFHRKHDGRDWFFMGNGTVEGFDPAEHRGVIDTEYFMNLVLENLPEDGKLADAVPRAREALMSRFPKVDSLVGAFLHPRGIEAYYDVADKFDRYHTLYRAETDGGTFICSENMEIEGLTWTPLREMGGLVSVPSYRKG
jgi:hypothetical protein